MKQSELLMQIRFIYISIQFETVLFTNNPYKIIMKNEYEMNTKTKSKETIFLKQISNK